MKIHSQLHEKIHKYLKFKVTEDENNNINYLDLSTHRNNHNLKLEFTENPHKHIQSPIKTKIRSM
jgi:hypothetical protein